MVLVSILISLQNALSQAPSPLQVKMQLEEGLPHPLGAGPSTFVMDWVRPLGQLPLLTTSTTRIA